MNKGEKLLYQDNKLAYQLILGFMILNTIMTIIVLKAMTIDYNIGAFIMYNISLSLVAFLLAIKVKKYNLGWGIFSIILGFIQFFVSFNLPELSNPGIIQLSVILIIASALILIVAGIMTILNAKIRRKFLMNRNV